METTDTIQAKYHGKGYKVVKEVKEVRSGQILDTFSRLGQ